MPEGSGDSDDEDDERDDCDPIPTASRRRQLATELERFDVTPVMSIGMKATMATMRMLMRRKKHHKSLMDQRRMWRTEGIVLESVKIGLYISDL